MKDPAVKNDTKSGGPSGWMMASQLGMALVGYTCLFGFGGYFIGDRLMSNKYWAIGLMLVGLVGGFAAAIYHIFRTSEKIDKSMPNRGEPLPDDTYNEEKS